MDGRTREGEAYAVLTSTGELVFFRSRKRYPNSYPRVARDVMGNEYKGRVFSGVETEHWSWIHKPEWHNRPITSVRIADGQAIAPVSCAYWFDGQRKMNACSLSGLDTSMVTGMSHMFYNCNSLATSPDTSEWDTSRVESMDYMFSDCSALKEPPDTSRWDTSNVTDMGHMFSGCRSLIVPPDTSGWGTSRVVDMGEMFARCHSLMVPPDTSGWDTGNVTDMSLMFWGCACLTDPPDTSEWDTSKVRWMRQAFRYCHNLTVPPDTSGWTLSSARDCDKIFDSCEALSHVPHLTMPAGKKGLSDLTAERYTGLAWSVCLTDHSLGTESDRTWFITEEAALSFAQSEAELCEHVPGIQKPGVELRVSCHQFDRGEPRACIGGTSMDVTQRDTMEHDER